MVSDNHGVTDPAATAKAFSSPPGRRAILCMRTAPAGCSEYLLKTTPRTPMDVTTSTASPRSGWIRCTCGRLSCRGRRAAEAVRQIEGFRRLLMEYGDPGCSRTSGTTGRNLSSGRRSGASATLGAAGMTPGHQGFARGMAEERAPDRLRPGGLDGCLERRRPDGLFHDVVDDPKTFGRDELGPDAGLHVFRGLKGAGSRSPISRTRDHAPGGLEQGRRARLRPRRLRICPLSRSPDGHGRPGILHPHGAAARTSVLRCLAGDLPGRDRRGPPPGGGRAQRFFAQLGRNDAAKAWHLLQDRCNRICPPGPRGSA